MLDYTILPRQRVSLESLSRERWKVFVSAFNSSPRVNALWSAVQADVRIWAVHREYNYDSSELPIDGLVLLSDGLDEAEFVLRVIDAVKSGCGEGWQQQRVAFDITGFMRAELAFLVRALKVHGFSTVDFFYAEPTRYVRKGWTVFSQGNVQDVRQVIGCEGTHDIDTSDDLLVIGTGYDDVPMASVAEHKPHARKALVFGLPSLLADMYQENVWRVSQAAESIGFGFAAAPAVHYAPANDPFVTAAVVSSLVRQARFRDKVTNVYLSPLGTKAQALGFAIYFAAECNASDGTSIVLPIIERYARETSAGVGRIWKYSVPFATLDLAQRRRPAPPT